MQGRIGIEDLQQQLGRDMRPHLYTSLDILFEIVHPLDHDQGTVLPRREPSGGLDNGVKCSLHLFIGSLVGGLYKGHSSCTTQPFERAANFWSKDDRDSEQQRWQCTSDQPGEGWQRSG